MPNLPTTLAQAIADLGLTIPKGAQRIAGCAPCENRAKYRAALKRLRRCTSDNPPESIALLEADLKVLGLRITITPEDKLMTEEEIRLRPTQYWALLELRDQLKINDATALRAAAEKVIETFGKDVEFVRTT